MTDRGYRIHIEVGEDFAVSERLHEALQGLADALASESDEVEGFQFKPGGREPKLDIGVLRGGGGKLGPVVDSFCLGFVVDMDTGDKSCTVYL